MQILSYVYNIYTNNICIYTDYTYIYKYVLNYTNNTQVYRSV